MITSELVQRARPLKAVKRLNVKTVIKIDNIGLIRRAALSLSIFCDSGFSFFSSLNRYHNVIHQFFEFGSSLCLPKPLEMTEFLGSRASESHKSERKFVLIRNTMQTAATNVTHELRMVWNNNLKFS